MCFLGGQDLPAFVELGMAEKSELRGTDVAFVLSTSLPTAPSPAETLRTSERPAALPHTNWEAICFEIVLENSLPSAGSSSFPASLILSTGSCWKQGRERWSSPQHHSSPAGPGCAICWREKSVSLQPLSNLQVWVRRQQQQMCQRVMRWERIPLWTQRTEVNRRCWQNYSHLILSRWHQISPFFFFSFLFFVTF